VPRQGAGGVPADATDILGMDQIRAAPEPEGGGEFLDALDLLLGLGCQKGRAAAVLAIIAGVGAQSCHSSAIRAAFRRSSFSRFIVRCLHFCTPPLKRAERDVSCRRNPQS